MNICLVRPATITTAEAVGEDAAPPLGLAYIAAYLRQHHHRVTVVDALGEGLATYTKIDGLSTGLRHGLADKETVARIPSDVQVIGVSCMFSLEWPFVRELIECIRRVFPDAIIIAGGEHITALTHYSLIDSGKIDYAVKGEGEVSLTELLNAIELGGPLDDVHGIAYIDNGHYRETTPRRRVRQLENIPWPAWDLIPLDQYFENKIMTGVDLGRSMPIMASRGCPYQCTFCSNPVMWGTLWRVRSAQDVLDEMQHYCNQYGVSNFDFYDLTAIVKRKWIIEFCHLLLDSGLNISWQLPSGTRSEAIDKEVSWLLAATGCRYMNYAPESGCEETLTRIKKKIDKPNMLLSMKHAVENKICVKANFILGFPDEGYRSVWETYKFSFKMAMNGVKDASFFPFSPYPGSELFDDILSSNHIVLNDQYFYSLSQYTDPRYSRSYSQHFSSRKLRLLCLGGMLLFYCISYVRRPLWALQLMMQVMKGQSKTKLGSSIVRVLKKRKALKYINVHHET